jgi:uncharacterized membrane protein
MSIKSLLQGLGIGAGVMYLCDPQLGRLRRSKVCDQWEHAKHCTEDFFDRAKRDLSNRASGVTAEARSMLRRDCADDKVIAARVRSKLGRYCSHPRAVAVESQDGHVSLSGQVLAEEAAAMIAAVCSVRGVKHVENHLEVYRQSGSIAALQGGTKPAGEQCGLLQESWSPATRAVTQLAGFALVANGLTRRGLVPSLLGTVGVGLILRATTNRSLAETFGAQTCPRPVSVQRTVVIHAPVEKVWDFLTDFEQLGRFLPGVKSLYDLGNDHYRWGFRIAGGEVFEIEERVTERVPEERLSWESISNSPVSYRGTVRLQREGDDATRLNVYFQYAPPGGAVGAALASLFGLDAKSQFQQAIMRIKPFLETGNAPHDLNDIQTGASPEHRQAVQHSATLSEVGQPEWIQGQPHDEQTSFSAIAQAGHAEPPGILHPEEIPPVHSMTDVHVSDLQAGSVPLADDENQERGRLG